jgi:hypothetical protein
MAAVTNAQATNLHAYGRPVGVIIIPAPCTFTGLQELRDCRAA